METLFGLLVLAVLFVAYKWLEYMWDEWSGAYGRWRRGEPLRASDLRDLERAAERERHEQHKAAMRRAYEADPDRILDRAFRQHFMALEIHREIRSEVIKRLGNRCGACEKEIRGALSLHVDHIRPKKHYPSLEFIASNLQVLCSKCNSHKNAYDGEDWRDVVMARRKAHRAKKAKAKAKAKQATR